MKQLHNTILNVYKKIFKPLLHIEVLGKDNKWNTIQSLNVTEKQQLYRIKTSKRELLCSKNHILIDKEGNEILAIQSENAEIIISSNKYEKVVSVEKTDIIQETYDLSLSDQSDHTYFCNGMLSHNCVILDEFAFVPKNIADKLFTSMFPIISSSKNGKIIVVSTPNGTGNLFYDIWKLANAKDKDNEGWKPFEMWWWQVPGHDENWKKAQIAAIGKERFAQEFNNEFISGSSFQKLIPDDVIENYRIRISKLRKENRQFAEGKELQIFSENQNKVFPFRMWHEFDPKRTYAAAADIAEGLGGNSDSSVLYIFDITDLSKITQCAKFASNAISPVEFAYVCKKILSLYANPYFICERNGVGASFLDILKVTYEYPNLVKEGRNGEYGVRSINILKVKALLWLKQMFTTVGYDWEIYDEDLFQEMSTFIKDSKTVNATYKAAVGTHDDLVMTICWLAWLLNPEIIEKYHVVVETFRTEYDEILPIKVMSQYSYSQKDIVIAFEDPLYRQYVGFKESMLEQYKKAMETERNSKNDLFNAFGFQMEPKKGNSRFSKPFAINSGYDGFTDDDFDGDSW